MTIDLNWNSVIQGVTTGIAASVVFGIISISKNQIKDFWFQRNLRREFNFYGFGSSMDGITVSIRNHLGKTFTIRRVTMLTEKSNLLFNATGLVESSFKGQSRKPTRKEIREMKKGKMIEVESEFGYKPWQTTPTQEGFSKIEPFTQHTFVLPASIIATHSITVKGLKITVEYEAWKEKRKILQIIATKHVDNMQRSYDNYRGQISSGSLNAARALFGMHPVCNLGIPPVPPNNQPTPSSPPSEPQDSNGPQPKDWREHQN